MTNEKKFYDELEKIFVGAEIKGKSGYINLMRIKSKYYKEGVFPKLQEYIKNAVKDFTEPVKFKEELFDKLYTFFKSYFSESGSVYFNFTPSEKDIYEKVYTDDKDVVLFWKTHMLYYVKSERLFRDLDVEIDRHKFFFDVSQLEHKKANEKRALIYKLKEVRNDGKIVFNVFYSEKGSTTKIDEILKELKRRKVNITEETLEKAFRIFEKQSEVDYFINKNAKQFLQEQFNLWLYQYVFKEKGEWTQRRIKQLQVYKDIAYKIIDFISQFEDELVKIWNKPKFVFNSNYVISLDRIAQKDAGMQVITELLKHKNIKGQIDEWKKLGIVDSNFDESKIIV
ncbi:MAG: site-specific DNA-methyltransferase, partial [candidate division WOR-3 bacterium]|nr:site-specific DNA-methyltransferase [candidate division WOR-3 bacterium]